MWRACSVTQLVYGHLLRYKHIITLDGEQERFFVETRFSKLFPFYLSFIPLTLTLLASLAVSREFARGNHEMSDVFFMVYIAASLFISLSHGLNFVFMRHGNDLCNLYFNTLIQYEAKLTRYRAPNNGHIHLLKMCYKGNILKILYKSLTKVLLFCLWVAKKLDNF